MEKGKFSYTEDSVEKKIPIDSYVAMIVGDDSYSGASLFSKKEKKKYVIPVYQRPYSWNETNIDDFLHTIIDGFYKNCTITY